MSIDWRPLAEAPKDGTWILCYYHHWDGENYPPRPIRHDRSGWVFADGVRPSGEPDGWVPLPPLVPSAEDLLAALEKLVRDAGYVEIRDEGSVIMVAWSSDDYSGTTLRLALTRMLQVEEA